MKRLFFAIMVVFTVMILSGCGNKENEVKSPQSAVVGDFIQLGTYNKKPLRWIVLEASDKTKLVIAEKVIDQKPFDLRNSEYGGKASWKNCTLRKWLNGEFYSTAFSDREKKMIGEAVKDNFRDRIFLPSCDDARKYCLCKGNEPPRKESLLYKIFKKNEDEKENESYLLSTEKDARHMWIVSIDGKLRSNHYVTKDGFLQLHNIETGEHVGSVFSPDGVRPMMWLLLNSEENANLINHDEEIIRIEFEEIENAPNKSIVQFGNYHGNKIDWICLGNLEVKGVLYKYLCTEKVIDCVPFNSWKSEVTWETCSLRKWLNKDFYYAAFNKTERERIQTFSNYSEDNPVYGTKGGNTTTDKVWCPTIKDVVNIMPKEKDRECKATSYAVSKGVWLNEDRNCAWWLRNPGLDYTYGSYVDSLGFIDQQYNIHVNNKTTGVRPFIMFRCSK